MARITTTGRRVTPLRRSDRERLRIVVDTREGQPYNFEPAQVETERKALPAGDYSLSGHEDFVAVERKTLEDFTNSLIRGRERFLREVERLAKLPHRCVVVEADLADVMGWRYRSGAHPHAVLSAAVSLMVDYGVPVMFCSDRQLALRFTEEYLRRVHQALMRGESEGNPTDDV
jgi:ERCC4-type nuclease